MSPPTKGSIMPFAPLQDALGPNNAISLRIDHWDVVLHFISAEYSAIEAIVPAHRDAKEVEAYKHLKKKQSIFGKYKAAKDTTEFAVGLEARKRQKSMFSRDNLSSQIILDKAVPVLEPEPNVGVHTLLLSAKLIIKRKTINAKGQIIEVDGKPLLTLKRQRATGRTPDSERPAKNLRVNPTLRRTSSPIVVKVLSAGLLNRIVGNKESHKTEKFDYGSSQPLAIIATNATKDSNTDPETSSTARNPSDLDLEASGVYISRKRVAITTKKATRPLERGQTPIKDIRNTKQSGGDCFPSSLVARKTNESSNSNSRNAIIEETSRSNKPNEESTSRFKSEHSRAHRKMPTCLPLSKKMRKVVMYCLSRAISGKW